MQNNPLIIIIVGAIALILGGILGYLAAILGGHLDKSLEDARQNANLNEPNVQKDQPGLHIVAQEILKVSVDAMLQVHLSLDGVGLEPNGLTAEQRARLVSVIVQIRPWIDGKVLPVSASTALTPMPEPKMSPPIAPVVAQAPAAATNKPVRVNAMRGFRSWLESDVKKPEPLLKNDIVSQIDEVLQKKLENSPLESKRIRIEEGSTGEVVVFVGASRYSGIDSVPDEAIRTIIQQAIKEWNDK